MVNRASRGPLGRQDMHAREGLRRRTSPAEFAKDAGAFTLGMRAPAATIGSRVGRGRRSVGIGMAEARVVSFGTLLRKLRINAGLTLEALGERVRLRPQSISRYECGRLAPRWRRLVTFVEVLGVGLVDVAGR